MFNIGFVFGITGEVRYLTRGPHGEFYLTKAMHEAGVLNDHREFKPMIEALRKVVEYGATIDGPDYDVWKDDRFELQFADEESDKSLEYTKYMRDMYNVGRTMYYFKQNNPGQQVNIQYNRLTPSIYITNQL